MTDAIRAAHVREALEDRHPEVDGEWVVLHEALRIDTLAIRCWSGVKGRGYRRIAYEIKVSKQDFDGEVRRPWKRQRAEEICDEFYFVMPWELAQRLKGDVPDGCGLLGVVRSGSAYTARQILKAKPRKPRPLTAEETATLIRWRAQPPALRNALFERHQRAEDVRRLRNQLAVATKALAEMAHDHVRPGVLIRPEWSDCGVIVVSAPRLERGRVKVRVRRSVADVDLNGVAVHDEHDEDLGYLLGLGYRIVQEGEESLGSGLAVS